MLRSVAEVSVLTGLSKVSIYNKIKLKEIEKYVVKNKGITYISDEETKYIVFDVTNNPAIGNNIKSMYRYLKKNENVKIDL